MKDDLINKIDKLVIVDSNCGIEYQTGYNDGLADAINIIRSAQFTEGDGWVKVEEDILPPMDEKTQIICADGEQYIGFYTGADNRGGDHWFCDNNDYHYPTHWRRLPQPPKQ